jgi:hypothetical protein
MKLTSKLAVLFIALAPITALATSASTLIPTNETFEALNKERQQQCPRLEKITNLPRYGTYSKEKFSELNNIANGHDICAAEAQNALVFFYVSNTSKRQYWEEKNNATYAQLIQNNNQYSIAKVCASFDITIHPDSLMVVSCKKLLASDDKYYLKDAKNAAILNLYFYYFQIKDTKKLVELCSSYIFQPRMMGDKFYNFFGYCDDATLRVANDYLTGYDGFKPDYSKGLALLNTLSLSSKRPDIQAEIDNQMGVVNGAGLGKPIDEESALYYFEKGLEITPENPRLLYSLGLEYLNLHQYPKAFSALLHAAKLGSANSQIRLAWLYIKGFGVLPDEKQAYAWLTVAIASGLDSPSEVAKANALKTALIHDLSVRDNAGTELKDAQNLAEQYYKKYVLQEKPVSQNPSTT